MVLYASYILALSYRIRSIYQSTCTLNFFEKLTSNCMLDTLFHKVMIFYANTKKKITLNIIAQVLSYVFLYIYKCGVVYNQAMKTANYDTFYYQLSITYIAVERESERLRDMKICIFVSHHNRFNIFIKSMPSMIIVAWERMLLISSLH